jgi:hypothetical protein
VGDNVGWSGLREGVRAGTDDGVAGASRVVIGTTAAATDA